MKKTQTANTIKRRIITYLIALGAAGLLTLLTTSRVAKTADMAVSDALYQRPYATGENIVIIGIDEKTLSMVDADSPWERRQVARVLELLNQTEKSRPAVIGVDILYTNETDAETDEWLARAAGQHGNVITACLLEFGDSLQIASGTDADYAVSSYFSSSRLNNPYKALQAATGQGHVNSALDTDGILRHHLLRLEHNGESIPSFALAVAEKYMDSLGRELAELPPTASQGGWYLPYCNTPGNFCNYISMADLIAEELSESARNFLEYCAGKIVLIGPYTVGLQDSYLTAIDHSALMHGVEYHANAIQVLMDGNYKTEVSSRRVQLPMLFVLLLAAMACFWRRSARLSTILWIALCGAYLIFCRAMYQKGFVLHALWIPAGITVLYAACLAFNYIQAALEKHRVTATFKRYVAPEIVQELLKENSTALELGGKQIRIAVLFVDVRGFTSMSEDKKPTQVVEILNEYLKLFARCILKNNGTLDKFVGDQAMAFWNAPLEQDDYVMKAVQTAVDMVNGLKEFPEHLRKSVSFGIGIHVGPAVVGNVGSPERMDYTAIGDTVNTAARLEANAPKGTIYISRAVADELKGRIRTSPLEEPLKLKGKKDGFEVLKLEEIYPSERPSPL